MRLSVIRLGSFALIVLFSTSSFAQAATPADAETAQPETTTLKPSGFEFGARFGFAIPLGSAVDGGPSLSHAVSGTVPIILDVGYRITPNWYVGAYGQYGFAFVNSDACASGVSCSAQSYRLGANVHYHIMPGQSFDPWVGLGTGYEWLYSSASRGSDNGSGSLSGFELVNFQVGGDIRLSPNAAIGPYASLSLSEYSKQSETLNSQSTDSSIEQTALHEWLTFGVRGRFDL